MYQDIKGEGFMAENQLKIKKARSLGMIAAVYLFGIGFVALSLKAALFITVNTISINKRFY